jgi:hypothetical protein
MLAMAARTASTLEGKMHFLARDPKYIHEKPYTMRYKPEGSIPQTNIERVEHSLQFHDMRGRTGPDRDLDLHYDACGFTVAKLENGGAMEYDDFADQEKLEGPHAGEVLAAVRKALGARDAQLIDYVMRRRHHEWPIATGETYEFQQPASRAHIGEKHFPAQCKTRPLTELRSYLRWRRFHHPRSTWREGRPGPRAQMAACQVSHIVN